MKKWKTICGRISKVSNKEVKNASWMMATSVIKMVLSFVVSIFMTRYLGPSNYGVIGYVSSFVAFFTSFCTLGIYNVIIKDFIEKPEEQGIAIGTTLVFRLVSSSISATVIVLIVSIIDRGEKETILAAILCSVALLFQTFDTFDSWFQMRYQSKISSLATLLAYVVSMAYKICLLILKKNVYWFAFSTSVDYICIALFLLLAYKKYQGPKLGFSFEKGKALLSKSYHYILSGMMVAIYGQTDKLMLKQMLSVTEVGYYSLATTINATWTFVLTAVISSIYPTILKLYDEGEIEAYKRKNRQMYCLVIYISIFVAIGIILFGKFFIILIYGKEYVDSAMSLNIVAWYTIFSYLGVARNAWLVCEDKQKYMKYIYFIAAILNVILNFIFIPSYGAAGAALASLITQFSTAIVIPAFIKNLRPNVKLMIDGLLLRGIR